jgi:hypothetical protein
MTGLSFEQLRDLSGGRLGVTDAPCPLCSHLRKPANRRLKVFRAYRQAPDFISFHCIHCEAKGWASDRATGEAVRPSPEEIEKIRADIAARDAAHTRARLSTALALWHRRREPGPATPTRTYLRDPRCYGAKIPATIGHLPASRDFPPAMIAAFGMARETEPGELAIDDDAIRGVHITSLKPDGSGKADTGRDKIMIGRSVGTPIVLAPPNDGLGLVICEGIENSLSAHEATGLGAWAAGSSTRMPALAPMVPDYIECVSIIADPDDDGIANAQKLAASLQRSDRAVRLIIPSHEGIAA